MPSWYGPLRADEFFTGTPPMGVSYSLTCQCRRSFSCALFFSVRASSMILCDSHACGPDFSSYLLQAQASGAKVVALANAGGDMINATKQANEFGLSRTGQTVVSLLVFITDIHGLGLAAAHGLRFVTGFYWDRDDETRAWAKRFFDLHRRMPAAGQAAIYSAIRHYLRAIEAAGTDEAKAVMAKMREMPVNDFLQRMAGCEKTGGSCTTCTSCK